MAHGEFFILGAYVVVWITSAGGSFWIAVLAAPIALALLGYVFQRGLLRSLQRDPNVALLVTWGVAMIVRQILQITMGPAGLYVRSPLPGSVSVFGMHYPLYRVVMMGISAGIFLFLLLLYLRSRFGLRLRAAIHNREMASAIGINTERVAATSFVMGSSLAGLAGALVSPLIPVAPLTGLTYLIKSFFIVVVGGAGNLLGTLAGGIVIGGGESVFQFFVNPVMAEMLVFCVALLIVGIRPQGLIKV
jgi:branched-chain amino acid transport system permease protein/urea transport system permease protein